MGLIGRSELRAEANGRTADSEGEMPTPFKNRRRGKLPASHLRKISEQVKARWATRQQPAKSATVRSGDSTVSARRHPKRTGLTVAGRKKLSDMMKARWTARRAGAAKK